MFYLIKTPFWLKKLYSSCTWQINDAGKNIYLSFDDGPHPEITLFVLEQLRTYNAYATFFCIGNNVKAYPQVYEKILLDGHAVGNHTFSHLNGWKTKDDEYMHDIEAAKKFIDSSLFRPPYGKITRFQLKLLTRKNYRLHPIMWTVLSADFDEKVTGEKCMENVIRNSVSGSIVVFHDSEKAKDKLKFALPRVLKHFSEAGYTFKKISL